MTADAPRQQVAWAELGFVTALAGVTLAYLREARGVSLDPQNLLLLQPAAWLVLVMWVVIVASCLRRPAVPKESRADLLRIMAMVTAFGAFIVGLEQVGYDIAIWAFVLVGLVIGGERNWLMLLVFPSAFTVAAVYGFRALVPYPFPTSLI